ncbi:lipopolysaccharide biosynthesis protein [Qipengyuania aquimaris]|uniref:lipopolysaccharide biosynthesis protein n=1 Tax=Qipengyuania aquimaris TaxID=255984 RepID=UPI001C93DA58|nr:lipopolysaccharide biosynthesis protein [Qipengyuania aquimaris]MBY6128398.1 lipopolysaccharide biosynthesis protein [Qipengyuania aquimaris]
MSRTQDLRGAVDGASGTNAGAHSLGELVRSRIASIAHLLTGNFGVAILMFASISLAARALGAAEFGALALILAVGRVSERLVRFESWQPLIRYVAQEENSGDAQSLSRLYAFGLLLDICSALLAAVLAISAGLFLGQFFGLEADQLHLVAIYACAIALNIRGMPSAALRMAGRFRTLAYIQGVSGLLRLLGTLVLLARGDGLASFVLLWTAAQIFDAMLFNLAGFRALRDQGVPNPLRASWRGLRQRYPGFLKFAFSTNLSSMLRTLTHEVDTLLVGALVGPTGAGLYYLARRIAKVAQQAGDLVQTVVYPDMARVWTGVAWHNMSKIVTSVQRVLAALALAAIFIVFLVGEPLLVFALGKDFADLFPLLLAQLVAVGLILHAAPSRSALLAMNRPGLVLVVAAAATALFFAVALLAIPQLGPLGANFAHIAFGLFTAVCLDIAMWRGIGARGASEKP